MHRVRSTDSWYNAPGIVAAYQPVAAPGPLLAGYNMAHGGDNRYKAGTLSSWSPTVGWPFTYGQYFAPAGLTLHDGCSLLVRYSNADLVTMQNCEVCGGRSSGNNGLSLFAKNNSAGLGYLFGHNHGYANSASPGRYFGTFVVSKGVLYESGIPVSIISVGVISGSIPFWIGGAYGVGSTYGKTIQAVALYERPISRAEAWSFSRQVQYCHINSEWSAWGRRRQYFYAPAQAAPTFQAAWAKRTNTLLGGGM